MEGTAVSRRRRDQEDQQGSAGEIHHQNHLIEDPHVVRETILEDTRMQDWATE